MRSLLVLCALFAGALLWAGFVAGCDDGGDGGAQATATLEEEEEEATPTEEEQEEATPTEEGEATEEPSGALPFDSFHYTVELEFAITVPGEEPTALSGTVEGDFVAPDSHAFTNRFAFGGLSGTEAVVIIGDQAWTREGEGEWEETASSVLDESTTDLTSADPEFFADTSFAEDLAALDSERETINGVETRRYHIPREAVDALVELLGEEFLQDASGLELEMTVWLEEESDALVRAEISAIASPEIFGGELPFDLPPEGEVSVSMVVNVTQINDPDITIEPPI